MFKRITVRKISVHVLAWLLYITYYYIGSLFLERGDPENNFLESFSRAIPALFPFYFSVYVFYPASFSGKRNYLSILGIIILFLSANWGYQYITYIYIFHAYLNPLGFTPTHGQFFIMSLNSLVHFSLFGAAFWYARTLSRTERRLRNYKTEKLQLEHQKLQLQYNVLQAQINPHFLYNTIGFFHSKAMKFSKETAKGMELLADIMRYSLSPAEPDGKVPLTDEVMHLKNFIELHQLRFDNALNIEFNQHGSFDDIRIPSHILITLVENAFKHGIFNDDNPPLKIDLNVFKECISFTVTNKINNSKSGIQTGNSGIGLNNIQSRLKKEYGAKSRMLQKTSNGIFTVELTVATK